MARRYNKWQSTEVKQLELGIIPKGRSYASCLQKAQSLGFEFKEVHAAVLEVRKWSVEEDDALRRGEFLEGRSREACRTRSRKLGFDIGDIAVATADDLAELSEGYIPRCWTQGRAKAVACANGIAEPEEGFSLRTKSISVEDLRILREGDMPAGWTLEKCRATAFRYGISYRPVQFKVRETRDRKAEEMYVLWKLGRDMRYISELYGVSKERVRQLIRTYIHSKKLEEPF